MGLELDYFIFMLLIKLHNDVRSVCDFRTLMYLYVIGSVYLRFKKKILILYFYKNLLKNKKSFLNLFIVN